MPCRAVEQDHVLSAVHKLAAVQGPEGGLIDLAGGEVEAREILVGRGEEGQPTVRGTVGPTNADFM